MDRIKERSFEEPGGEGMRTIHDYDSFTDALLEKAYQQGLRDGRATKPLRWRTDPIPRSISPGDEGTGGQP